jgi:hypothetical protein
MSNNELKVYLKNVYDCLDVDPEVFSPRKIIFAHSPSIQKQLTTILDQGKTVTVSQVSQQQTCII